MDGWLTIGTELDTKGFEKQINEVEYELEQLEYELSKKQELKLDSRTISEYEAKAEKLRNKLLDLRKKQEDLNRTDLSEVSKNIDNIGNSITRTIKKVGKWALAVFGVRSAYMAIRGAMSILSQYNDQLATDIEYIKFAVATTLQPVIEWIIKLVYKLLGYVNYLAKAWFGINLFANASADAMNKGAKSAEKIKKSLTGFDEMNVVSDTSTSSNNQGGTPSYDLSKIEDVPIPKWLETVKEFGNWIKDNWPLVLLLLGGTALAVMGIKALSKGGGIEQITKGFNGFLTSLGKATQAIAILGGIALVINEITDLIEVFSNSGMTLGDVAGLLGIVLGSLVIAFGLLSVALKTMDWSSIAGAVVIFGGLALILTSVSNLLDTFAKTGMSVGDVGLLLLSIFGVMVGLMVSVALLGPAMTEGLVPFAAVMGILMATLGVMALTLPTILEATGNFIDKVAPNLEKILRTIGDLIVAIIYSLGTSLPPIIQSVGNLFKKIFDGISKVINTVGNTIVKILNTAKSLVTTVLSSILNFINKLGPAINNFVDNAIKAVTKLINFMISGIEYLVNTLIVDGINKIINGINSIGEYVGFTIPVVADFKIPRFTPKLKTGGIINMPGRGVPVGYGRAIGGEAGKEGVLPLTDSQAMEELGSAIGRYITINLTNNTNLDGRRIARQQTKVQANRNFAMNR